MLLFVVLQIFVAFVIGFATAISLAVWALRNLNVFQLFGLERRARQLKREDVISASLRDRSQLQWREQQLHNEFVKRRFGELELDIERVVAVVNAYQEIVMQRLISVADPEAQSDAKKASKASSKSRKASHTPSLPLTKESGTSSSSMSSLPLTIPNTSRVNISNSDGSNTAGSPDDKGRALTRFKDESASSSSRDKLSGSPTMSSTIAALALATPGASGDRLPSSGANDIDDDGADESKKRFLVELKSMFKPEHADGVFTVSPGDVKRSSSPPAESLEETQVIREGWMYVKTMGMWQKRYFKLAGQLLSFYKAKGGEDQCLGSIKLQGCQIRRKTAKGTKTKKAPSLQFDIYHPEKKPIFKTQMQGLLPSSVLQMGDHLQNLPPSMRELHNTLHQGTLDLIDRKKIRLENVEKRVPIEARRLIQNTVQRQTNRWICSLRVKEQAEFDAWLHNIYSVISQDEEIAIEEVPEDDEGPDPLLEAELEAARADESDENQLFLQIEEIEKQRELEERQKERDKYPSLYSEPGVSREEREQQLMAELRRRIQHWAEDEGVTLIDRAFEQRVMRRFFRAREYDLERTFAMFTTYLKWVQAYLPHEISLESVADEIAQHKVYFHGTDMQGRPNVIVHLSKHNPRISSVDDTLQLLVFLIEQAQKILRDRPDDKLSVIFDYTGFSTSMMDWTLTKEAIVLLQNYYPEQLGALYLVNYPVVLHPLWKVVRPWLNSNTRSKIYFLDSPKKLLSYFEPENLPIALGGLSRFQPEGLSFGLETVAPIYGSPLQSAASFGAIQSSISSSSMSTSTSISSSFTPIPASQYSSTASTPPLP